MANIRKINGKRGVSYQITVSQGRDLKNQQNRRYRTWRPPAGMTERQAEKEVLKVAMQFEQQLEQGYVADDRQTVEEYARYFIDLKERSGTKHATIKLWNGFLDRVLPRLGHMKIRDVRPKHINDFHQAISGEGVRRGGHTATAKPELREKVLAHCPITTFLTTVEISHASLAKAFRGERISLAVAQRIAAGLQQKTEALFTIHENKKPLSGATLKQYYAFLSSMFQNATNEMLIPYNPVSKAKAPKVEEREVASFEGSEIDRILLALENEPLKWKTVTYLTLITGARRGEVAGLQWQRVDFDNLKINISYSLLYASDTGLYLDTTKSRKSKRAVSIPSEVMDILREHKTAQLEMRLALGDRWHEQDYVFTQENGDPMYPDSITGWMNEFAKRHIHPHKFRHTHASQLLEEGVNIAVISKRLGHSRTSTTQDIYTHVLEGADARVAEKAADIFLRGNKKHSSEEPVR
ncbi:site-specific integrase [Eubacteriales bacterium OttesenSCG-928-A19]|nr:site-specific integrase [Eubacteriales bacterium OttesenSCG-928-A19]